MKNLKRFLSLLLVVAMMFSFAPQAFAEEAVVTVAAKVVEVQKYGNLKLDIKAKALYDAGFEPGDMMNVAFNGKTLEMPLCTSFSDVDSGSLLIRDDQKRDDLLVAINMGDFAKTYDVKVGAEITFSLKEKKGYYVEYLMRQLKRSNERADYATDSIFANFRAITTSGIKPGVIYRSSSPINNEIFRATYANELAKAVGIKTVVNLADNADEIKQYVAAEGFNSDYYKKLVDNGDVALLDMGIDVSSKEFATKLVQGLRFMASHEGPYLVHCTEGKDRAGFASAIIEGLMGASMEEISEDYMRTYENYYKVEKDSEKYQKIAEANIIMSFTTAVFGLEKGADISKVNVKDAVEKYLVANGLTESEVASLRGKLSGDAVFKLPSVVGKVTKIEKYGHADTDISIENFNSKGFKIGDMLTVVFDNGFVVEAPYLDGYLVDNGYPLVRAYPGHKTIAVCINYGKLNKVANIKEGDGFTIAIAEKEAYLLKYQVRKLERTNNREDYASDEVFANFRPIKIGNIAEGMLFRSSSPINNELGRAKYADVLIKAAGVQTVVNLADNQENIDKYVAGEDFASPYYAELLKNNKVILLNLGMAFNSDEFKAGIAKGVQFMSANSAPYHFHCTEGKDRAGYMAVFLSSLMGAEKDAITEDYMQSYINYYKIEKGSDKYQLIMEDVVAMMKSISGSSDLSSEALKKGAEKILTDNGVTAEEIKTVREKLSVAKVQEDTAPVKPVVEEKVEAVKSDATVKYTVAEGDSLWRIAEKMLGNGKRYMDIYELNKAIIKALNLIFPGQVFDIPLN